MAPIAQTGTVTPMVVVREDSRFQDLNGLLDESADKPNSLRFGADVGSLAHFMAMEIEQSKPGSALNYITCGGGQKRFTLLLGGHLDAAIFSLSEYLAFRASNETPPDQNIRALAVLQAERHSAIRQALTAMEQGVPIDVNSVFYWLAPEGTPEDVVDRLASVLEATLQDPVVVAGLALGIGIGSLRTKGSDKEIFENDRGERGTALVALAVFVGYVVCLQLGVPYATATALAIFILGATIASWNRERLFSIGQLALLFALGSEFVFVRIFSVPFP